MPTIVDGEGLGCVSLLNALLSTLRSLTSLSRLSPSLTLLASLFARFSRGIPSASTMLVGRDISGGFLLMASKTSSTAICAEWEFGTRLWGGVGSVVVVMEVVHKDW
ncbi:hypothetical protein BOTBODRAFT_177810 [Botryobasidium botryosum FD-172 SS1]|uniref:Uncharacterized protein n=1 Tax=Botryobasidium botryosum (strain FD-172 SS1) TaxID=930990 RepID=A0A067MGC8_BOTB1|nr:hypothetical protein BOTBODRAFT_177810 [Botryobasidium botryosum FD-172 SS1]